jgi:hypothetical protein
VCGIGCRERLTSSPTASGEITSGFWGHLWSWVITTSSGNKSAHDGEDTKQKNRKDVERRRTVRKGGESYKFSQREPICLHRAHFTILGELVEQHVMELCRLELPRCIYDFCRE